jgi:hypothetical protein
MNIYTIEECNKWKHNKNINPKTNRIIKIGAATYNEIEKQCKAYNISSIFSNFCKNNNIKSNNSLNSIEKKIYHKFNIFCNDIKKDKKKDEKKDENSDINSDKKKDENSDKKKDENSDKKKIDLTQFIDKNVKIKSFTDYEKDYIEYLKNQNYDQYVDYVKDKESEEKKEEKKKEDYNSKNCITLMPKKEERVKFSLFNLFQKPKISYNYLLMNNNIKLYKPFGKQTENSIIYKSKNINKKNKFLIKIKLQQT